MRAVPGRSNQNLAEAMPARARGFSLIELMITLAVLAVLAALAAPSFTSLFNSNRLTSHANEVVTSLQLARMEAIRRNASVTVCRTSDGATCDDVAGAWGGWLTVVASDGEVLRTNTVKSPVQVTSGAASITFRPDGLARGAAGGALTENSITVCIPTTRPQDNRRVVALVNGSRISTDSENGAGACP
jgi:type IV fimbrial biogenesis protein FimT